MKSLVKLIPVLAVVTASLVFAAPFRPAEGYYSPTSNLVDYFSKNGDFQTCGVGWLPFTVKNTASGYTMDVFAPDTGEYLWTDQCVMRGNSADCSPGSPGKSEFVWDLHEYGVDMVLTFLGAGNHTMTWVSETTAHEHGKSHVTCEGTDCAQATCVAGSIVVYNKQ